MQDVEDRPNHAEQVGSEVSVKSPAEPSKRLVPKARSEVSEDDIMPEVDDELAIPVSDRKPTGRVDHGRAQRYLRSRSSSKDQSASRSV